MPTLLRIIAAFALSCLAIHAANAGDPPEKAPVTIAEVHTWGDLLAQKPILLPGAHGSIDTKLSPVCRVGIDLTYARLYGAAVLYCLSDVDNPIVSDDNLGPLELDIKTDPTPVKDVSKTAMGGLARNDRYFFYIKVIPLNSRAEYTITLGRRQPGYERTPLPVAIAKISIAKQEAEFASWSPWGNPHASDDSRSLGADNPVSNPATAIAIPDWPRGASVAFEKLPDPKTSLPPLFPAQPDPGLHLSIAGNRLTLKSDKKDLLNIDYFGSILTRWWVNGKPFTPPAPDNNEIPADNSENGLTELENEYNYHLEFHPEILHAKKGDTIGLQLLYCPGGFQYTLPPQGSQARALNEAIEQGDPAIIAISRLSNRIEFTYTGDPASISPHH